jgi:hypothetical protein
MDMEVVEVQFKALSLHLPREKPPKPFTITGIEDQDFNPGFPNMECYHKSIQQLLYH